ncbi:myosin heavy chain-related protein, partial [Striga asiatica]
ESHVLGSWTHGHPPLHVFEDSKAVMHVFEDSKAVMNGELEVTNPFSVAYQHSGDPHWQDLRFTFEEVYLATETILVVQDRNSTNAPVIARNVTQTHVVSDNSYHNSLQHVSSRNIFSRMHTVCPHDASSEYSVNAQVGIIIARSGGQPNLRIPRPPCKSGPTSCRGTQVAIHRVKFGKIHCALVLCMLH